jgi:hypothetical protein
MAAPLSRRRFESWVTKIDPGSDPNSQPSVPRTPRSFLDALLDRK